MVRRVALGCATALAVLLVPFAAFAGAGAVGEFTIDPLSGTQQAGSSVTVTGEGCPPVGDLPSDLPLILVLTPPSGGNQFAPSLMDGEIVVVITGALFLGESLAEVTPNADGSFEAILPIPEAAPSGPYTVRGLCNTLLEAGDTPTGLTEASVAAATVEQSGLTIEALPVTTVPTPTTPPAPPVSLRPAFTG